MWTKESIRELLERNDQAVARGVVALYKRQTADERSIQETKHSNGIGFNSSDARYLSWVATYAQRTGRVTGRHLIKTRAKLLKYSGQLADIANAKQSDARVDEKSPNEVEDDRVMKQMYADAEREAERRAFESEYESWG